MAGADSRQFSGVENKGREVDGGRLDHTEPQQEGEPLVTDVQSHLSGLLGFSGLRGRGIEENRTGRQGRKNRDPSQQKPWGPLEGREAVPASWHCGLCFSPGLFPRDLQVPCFLWDTWPNPRQQQVFFSYPLVQSWVPRFPTLPRRHSRFIPQASMSPTCPHRLL